MPGFEPRATTWLSCKSTPLTWLRSWRRSRAVLAEPALPSNAGYAMDRAARTSELQPARATPAGRTGLGHRVSQIRKLDNFKNFLAPVPFADLQEAAVDGPVVIVSIGADGSHALVISHDKAAVQVVELPEAGVEQLLEQSRLYSAPRNERAIPANVTGSRSSTCWPGRGGRSPNRYSCIWAANRRSKFGSAFGGVRPGRPCCCHYTLRVTIPGPPSSLRRWGSWRPSPRRWPDV